MTVIITSTIEIFLIYVLCWWMSLFIILPIGIKNIHEATEEEKGKLTSEEKKIYQHDKSIPFKPNLSYKFLLTSMIASGLVILYALTKFYIK